MHKRRLGALLFALAAGFATSCVDARGSTCDYTGVAGGSWHSAGNWTCDATPAADADGIPDGDDDVRVLLTDTVVVSSDDEAAKSLTVDTGATLQFANARTLTVSGATALGQATLSGAGTLLSNGSWSKAGTQALVVSGITMRLAAASTWTDGTLCLDDAATWKLSGRLDVAATADNLQHCGGDVGRLVIDPAGTFAVAGGNRFVNTAVDDGGLVDLAAGTLTLNGTPLNSHAGHFAIAAPAILVDGADLPLTATGVIDGAGTFRQTSGTVTVPAGAAFDPGTTDLQGGVTAIDGATPAMILDSLTLRGGALTGTRNRSIGALDAQAGTLGGPNLTTVTGSMTKTTGNALVLSATTLRPIAPVTWSDGSYCLNDAATFQLTATMHVQAAADNVQHCGGTIGRLLVTATGVLDVAGGNRFINSALDNDGIVDLVDGQLTLSGQPVNAHAGRWQIAAPAALLVNSDMPLAAAGTIEGAGTLRQSAGTLTAPENALFDPGTTDLVGGVTAVEGDAPAVHLDLVTLRGGTFTGARDRTIDTLDAQTGTLAGTNTTTVTAAMTKTTGNTLVLDTLAFEPAVDMTWADGAICLDSASSLHITHRFTIGNAADGVLHCSGTTGQVHIAAGGRLDRSGAGSSTLNPPIHNRGAIPIGAGQTLTFGNLSNEAGGTLSGAGTAGGPVTNAGGTINPGGGELTLSGSLAQSSGTTAVDPGDTLTVAGDHVQSGGAATIASGGTLSAAAHALSGGITRVGGELAGPATLTGGAVLDGGGQVTGDLTNTAGDVRPGTSPGALVIDGDYAQGAGGTLTTDITGATTALFDRLAVTGDATLAGTLAIVQGGPFDPANGDVFQVVSSASRTGSFGTVTGTALSGNRSYQVIYPGGPSFGAQLVVDLPAAPTPGTPVVTGTTQVGQTVTCLEGAWTGSPVFTYQWLREGAAIGGAVARTYVVAGADATHTLSCRVTGTNGGGSAQATSAGVDVPAPTPTPTPTPTAAPTATPTATPAPKPKEPIALPATPSKVATAFGLRSAKRCVSKPAFPIRLREPSGIRIRRARITFNGRAVRVRKRAGRFRAAVDLRGLAKGHFTIVIRITTTDGRAVTGKRTYRICAGRHRGAKAKR